MNSRMTTGAGGLGPSVTEKKSMPDYSVAVILKHFVY